MSGFTGKDNRRRAQDIQGPSVEGGSTLHPVVRLLNPSHEQTPAVCLHDRDIVVVAGAGTGKTRTLVARYLALLAEGLPLRSVVAITFTRKAAREMRNRVRATMRDYLSQGTIGAEERRRWERLYVELDAARIGTIHNLCAEILRSHPAEADVDPRFDVLDESRTIILRRRAVEEAMAWGANDVLAARVFSLLGERELRTALESLMNKISDAAEVFDRFRGCDAKEIMQHWRDILQDEQRRLLYAVLERGDWRDAVAVCSTHEAICPGDLLEIQRQCVLQAVCFDPEDLTEACRSLSELANADLRGGKHSAWPGGKEELAQVKAAIRQIKDIWKDMVKQGLYLAPNHLDEEWSQAMPGLALLFDVACTRYAASKRAEGLLDFDDLEVLALRLLKGDASARARWQSEIRAILVDEYQDTNGRQRDLVNLLKGDAKTLFIVGDAKQSIYRFRGADVTVFREERSGIIKGGGESCHLETSYRAHAGLIDGLNAILRPVLGEVEDVRRPWVEPFSPIQPHRQAACPGFLAPYIEFHLAVGTKAEAKERAADAVVARIIGLVEKGDITLEKGNARRPLDYGDVAILCRASSSFPAYEDALEKVGVPFLTVAGGGFFGRPEVRDVLNSLQAIADPTDDTALAGLLRSPAFGLKDVSLYHCVDIKRQSGKGSLWEALREGLPDLIPAEQEKLVRALDIVFCLHQKAGRTLAARLLKEYLDTTSFLAALLAAGRQRAARNVRKLVYDASVSGIVGVGEFLEYVAGLRDSGAREGEARAIAEGAIQIMSVHAAKGLEFPVVVIGDAGYEPNRASNEISLDQRLGALVPLKSSQDAESVDRYDKESNNDKSAVYRLAEMTARDKDRAESDRLLYVAATRAEELLLVSGCVTRAKDGRLSKLGGWLGRLTSGPLSELKSTAIEGALEEMVVQRKEFHIDDVPVTSMLYGPAWRFPTLLGRKEGQRMQAEGEIPRLLQPLSPADGHADDKMLERMEEPPRRVWRVVPVSHMSRPPAWVVGKLVHDALALWRFPDERFAVWAESRARGFGLVDGLQIRGAIGRAAHLLSRFQAHHLYQEMACAERRLHEVPYMAKVDGRVEYGSIDALFLNQGHWSIVEFKTHGVEDEKSLEEMLSGERYIEQMDRYRRAVRLLIGQEARIVFCLLDYRGHVYVAYD